MQDQIRILSWMHLDASNKFYAAYSSYCYQTMVKLALKLKESSAMLSNNEKLAW